MRSWVEDLEGDALRVAEQARGALRGRVLEIVASSPGLATADVQDTLRRAGYRGLDVAELLEGMARQTPAPIRRERRGNGSRWYPGAPDPELPL